MNEFENSVYVGIETGEVCDPFIRFNPDLDGVNFVSTQGFSCEGHTAFPFTYRRWNPEQPLNCSISLSAPSETPRTLWLPDAWEQAKNTFKALTSLKISDLWLGADYLLEQFSAYLAGEPDSIVFVNPADLFTECIYIPSSSPIAKPQRLIRMFRKVFSKIQRKFTLSHGKIYLVPVFQSDSVETSAHEHTLHMESIDLARAHSQSESIQKEKLRLDSGSADVCKRFLFTCGMNFSGHSSAALPVCACIAYIGII